MSSISGQVIKDRQAAESNRIKTTVPRSGHWVWITLHLQFRAPTKDKENADHLRVMIQTLSGRGVSGNTLLATTRRETCYKVNMDTTRFTARPTETSPTQSITFQLTSLRCTQMGRIPQSSRLSNSRWTDTTQSSDEKSKNKQTNLNLNPKFQVLQILQQIWI